MVLFTANNISAPSNTYKITQETVSTDASGSLLNLVSLSVIPSLTAPTFVSLNTTVSQSGVVSNQKNTISFNTAGINLFMSDGSTNTIFDNVYTGLNTLEFMMSRNQYYLMGSDDVMIINVDGVKFTWAQYDKRKPGLFKVETTKHKMISLCSKMYCAAEDTDYCECCACKNIECKCVKKCKCNFKILMQRNTRSRQQYQL